MDTTQEDVLEALDAMPQHEGMDEMMQDDVSLLNVLLSKDEITNSTEVPEEVKNAVKFYTKTLALSNIERKDIFPLLMGFDDIKMATIMSKPKAEYTWNDEIYWTAAKEWLRIEATRGVEGFERMMQATQIHQSSSSQNVSQGSSQSNSILGVLTRWNKK